MFSFCYFFYVPSCPPDSQTKASALFEFLLLYQIEFGKMCMVLIDKEVEGGGKSRDKEKRIKRKKPCSMELWFNWKMRNDNPKEKGSNQNGILNVSVWVLEKEIQ